MNEYEDIARAHKANRLYRLLRGSGVTSQTLRLFTYRDWIATAKAAGTYTPSETTIAIITDMFKAADRPTADPFADLADPGGRVMPAGKNQQPTPTAQAESRTTRRAQGRVAADQGRLPGVRGDIQARAARRRVPTVGVGP